MILHGFFPPLFNNVNFVFQIAPLSMTQKQDFQSESPTQDRYEAACMDISLLCRLDLYHIINRCLRSLRQRKRSLRWSLAITNGSPSPEAKSHCSNEPSPPHTKAPFPRRMSSNGLHTTVDVLIKSRKSTLIPLEPACVCAKCVSIFLWFTGAPICKMCSFIRT